MNWAAGSGRGLHPCCRVRLAIRGGPARTTVRLSTVVREFCAPARIGAICRGAMASGRQCILAALPHDFMIAGGLVATGVCATGLSQCAQQTLHELPSMKLIDLQAYESSHIKWHQKVIDDFVGRECFHARRCAEA